MGFLLLLLLIMVGLWLYRDYQQQRERRDSVVVVPPPNKPLPPRHQRVTDAEVRERASTLRRAIDSGTVTLEEATESLSRTCGISKESARKRLSG